MELWILGDISAAQNFNYSLCVMWPRHWHVVIWWFHVMVTHTSAHANLDRLVSPGARTLSSRLTHTHTHAVPLHSDTHGRDPGFFQKRGRSTHTHTVTQQHWKNRGTQPMFVMAARTTFPPFNSGICSQAKNLLQCHRLPGTREKRRVKKKKELVIQTHTHNLLFCVSDSWKKRKCLQRS